MKHTIATTQNTDGKTITLTYEVQEPYVHITGTIPKNRPYNKRMTVAAARVHYRKNIQNGWTAVKEN